MKLDDDFRFLDEIRDTIKSALDSIASDDDTVASLLARMEVHTAVSAANAIAIWLTAKALREAMARSAPEHEEMN